MTDNFIRHKLEWMEQVTLDASLPANATRVANRIASHMNSKTRFAYPSISHIAKMLNLSPNAVRQLLHALQSSGHLHIKFGGGRLGSNQYRWVLKSKAAAGVATADTPLMRYEAPPSSGVEPNPFIEPKDNRATKETPRAIRTNDNRKPSPYSIRDFGREKHEQAIAQQYDQLGYQGYSILVEMDDKQVERLVRLSLRGNLSERDLMDAVLTLRAANSNEPRLEVG